MQQSAHLGFAGLYEEAVGEDLFDGSWEIVSKGIDQEVIGGLFGRHAGRPGISNLNGKVLWIVRFPAKVRLSV